MKIFDPDAHRRRLDGDTGYRWSLSRSMEESRAVGGLASSAHAYLNMAVRCILVGYGEPASLLLSRAREWLAMAIQLRERPRDYAAGGSEARRHLDLALCNWMLKDIQDQENFDEYIRHEETFLNRPNNHEKDEISFVMPHYINAGAYDKALQRCTSEELPQPASPGSAQTEGQMGYVLCRHYLSGEYSAKEIEYGLASFLKRNTNSWLVDGHFLRAAEWMKIAHWNSASEDTKSSSDAVLRCYDYLTVPKPART